MARTQFVDSAQAQFFINLVDNHFLNHKNDSNYGYAVFGRVTQGMDVVDKIARVKKKFEPGFEDLPAEDIVIKRVTRYQEEKK